MLDRLVIRAHVALNTKKYVYNSRSQSALSMNILLSKSSALSTSHILKSQHRLAMHSSKLQPASSEDYPATLEPRRSEVVCWMPQLRLRTVADIIVGSYSMSHILCFSHNRNCFCIQYFLSSSKLLSSRHMGSSRHVVGALQHG